jgi:glycosyltransferase involved in cell wall biosynthesis
MISVITPTYNTPPNVLARTWASLKAQTFTDWEWVVWDDSTDPKVSAQLYGFASDERYRLRVFRSHVHSGSVGQVKRWGFMVAEGDYLVELDHDDELTSDALAEIARAFEDDSVGFVFSDWCELFPDGTSGKYPPGWAFGYGREKWLDDLQVWSLSVPVINGDTLRHIVSVPNHVRAWRASVYRELNGHDPHLGVADDYDLIVRTALTTGWEHIPKMLYKQHISPTTTQRVRNKEIQERVAELSAKYSIDIDLYFD